MESISDLEPIISSWHIDQVTNLHQIREGLYRVDLANGPSYALKFVGAENEKVIKRLQFEYEVLQHVQGSGIPVAVPLLSKTDTPYFIAAGKVYRLSHWLPHRPAEIITRDDHEQMYRNYGSALARIHQALAAYKDSELANKTWRIDLRARIFDQAVPSISTGLDEPQKQEFQSLLDQIQPDMMSSVSDLPSQLALWDCHAGNMTVDGFEISGFIDCDHICIAPKVFDLADFLVHLIKWNVGDESKVAQWLENIRHFLTGYESVTSLSKQQRDSLYCVMAGVPMLFMDFFLQAGLREPTKTEQDLFRFLVLHRNEITNRLS